VLLIVTILAMKRSIFTVLLLSLGMLILPRNVSAGRSIEDQVKRLVRRYDEVEAQLDRSLRYVKKEVSGGEITIEQAWFNGAGDPIKVATEHTTPGGREVKEYFAPDFDHADDAMFMLTRRETAQPDGATQVDESRKYFGEVVVKHEDQSETSNGELIRELTKIGRFKSGESLDTVHVPNVVVDLAKQPKDNRSNEERSRAQYEFFFRLQKIATALQQAGPPDTDPFANVTGDSEKYRVIHGTASPDGRYAIALGFSRGKVDWQQLNDLDFPGTYAAGDYDYDTDDAASSNQGRTVNYVVDVTTRHILGETGCGYFGTRRRYNHRECVVVWSPDSKNFAQLTTDKWNYVSCRAGRIKAGPKLAGTVDLAKHAEKSASNFLAMHKHGSYQGSIAIGIDEVTDQDVIGLTILGQEASVPRRGDVDFSLTERIRLRETPTGLRLETANVRYAPEE
jgi:hypothetical protein